MLELISDPSTWASLATLTLMEVVLGIDNIVFITILASKLPESERNRARVVGLSLALVTRFILLLMITWIIGLKEELFQVAGHGFSGRDLILLAGGLFLIYKATTEIHEKLEGPEEVEGESGGRRQVGFVGTIIQIALLDIVFSLDSVITAVGMTDHLPVMMAAVVLSIGFMLWAGRPMGDFVMRHPTVKMLALSFLLLIGMSLLAEAFHKEISKGYIYSAMAFSIVVESLNLWASKRQKRRGKSPAEPVHLRRNVVGVQINREG